MSFGNIQKRPSVGGASSVNRLSNQNDAVNKSAAKETLIGKAASSSKKLRALSVEGQKMPLNTRPVKGTGYKPSLSTIREGEQSSTQETQGTTPKSRLNLADLKRSITKRSSVKQQVITGYAKTVVDAHLKNSEHKTDRVACGSTNPSSDLDFSGMNIKAESRDLDQIITLLTNESTKPEVDNDQKANLDKTISMLKNAKALNGHKSITAGSSARSLFVTGVKSEYMKASKTEKISDLLSKVKLKSKDGESAASSGKLQTEERENCFNALKSNSTNWFELDAALSEHAKKNPKDQAKCDQLRYDVRQLQIEISDSVQEAIDADYMQLTEEENVRASNEMFGQIFQGRESGTVFDTNYYTGGVIRETKIEFADSHEKALWMDNMDVMAKTKMAQQFLEDAIHHTKEGETPNVSGAKKEFETFVNGQLKGMEPKDQNKLRQQYKKAWHKAQTRHDKIQTKMKEVKEQHPNLTNAECQLAAMNRLYEENLAVVEGKINTKKELENELKTALQAAKKNGSSTESESIAELKKSIETATREAIEAQSDALMYANEPYYSQATVVAIVDGMQRKFGKIPDDFKNKFNENNPGASEADIQQAWYDQIDKDYPMLKDPVILKFAASENMADFKKCTREYEIKSGDDNSAQKHIVKASKYGHRALMLFKMSIDAKESEGKTLAADLKEFQNDINTSLGNIQVVYDIRQGKAKLGEGDTHSGKLLNDKSFTSYCDKSDLKNDNPVNIANNYQDYMMDLLSRSEGVLS